MTPDRARQAISLVDLSTPGGTPGGSSTSLRELDER